MSHGPVGRGAVARSRNFRESGLRLVRVLRPWRMRMAVVTALIAASVFLNVLGPKLLGDATNVIFSGVVGRMIPAGVTRD